VLIDRYRLIRPVASGGMATVWEGHDEILARDVAVKAPHPHLAADPVFSQRFRREAVAAARLSHPNIVATYDTGTDGDMPFIVMELVRGRTLKQALADGGAQPVAVAVGIAVQVADALDAAHRAGLIHRDVKPANILLLEHRPPGPGGPLSGQLDPGGLWSGPIRPGGPLPTVKVADFGVARLYGLVADDTDDLTGTGTVVGTARYLAPEQVEGGALDARTDVYALGVVLYEQLCGQPPFQRPTDLATAMAHVHDAPVPPGRMCPGLRTGLEAIVLACLAKSPADRPPSARDLATALRSFSPEVGDGPAGPEPRADGGHGAALAAPTIAGPLGPAPDRTAVLPTPPPPGPQYPPHGQVGPGGVPVAAGPPPRRAHRSRAPFVIVVTVVIAALVTALVVLALLDSGSGRSPARPGEANNPSPATPVSITAARSFDPEGDGTEGDARARLVFDGDPATLWSTDQYRGPAFGHLKSGVGIYVRLDHATAVHTVEVQSPTQGWSASIYVAGQPAPTLTGWGQPVGSQHGVAGSATFAVKGTGQYVLVWITDPGPADRAEIGEIRVS
jgi:serine/threonine-protein kinase